MALQFAIQDGSAWRFLSNLQYVAPFRRGFFYAKILQNLEEYLWQL